MLTATNPILRIDDQSRNTSLMLFLSDIRPPLDSGLQGTTSELDWVSGLGEVLRVQMLIKPASWSISPCSSRRLSAIPETPRTAELYAHLWDSRCTLQGESDPTRFQQASYRYPWMRFEVRAPAGGHEEPIVHGNSHHQPIGFIFFFFFTFSPVWIAPITSSFWSPTLFSPTLKSLQLPIR